MVGKQDMSSELRFPLKCHYRIIALDQPNMKFVIETVAMSLGATTEVVECRKSAGGKYVSFYFDMVLDSKEEMARFDKEFRAIEGVKMVL